MKIRVDGSAAYVADEPDEQGRHHGEWKHTDAPVCVVWNDEANEWEETDMSDNRVTITMSDGTTREVHPDTPVMIEWGRQAAAVDAAPYNTPVTTVFEPVREDWTPFEPWMRDVLADDARVSWASGGTESRSTWDIYRRRTDSWAAGVDLRVCPDDAPERPTEDDPLVAVLERVRHRHAQAAVRALDKAGLLAAPERPTEDPDEALAKALKAEYGKAQWWLDVARAAREHIEGENRCGTLDALAEEWEARAVQAESERDEWKAHYMALRTDVEGRCRNVPRWADPVVILTYILERDNERGEQFRLSRELDCVLDRDEERGEQA